MMLENSFMYLWESEHTTVSLPQLILGYCLVLATSISIRQACTRCRFERHCVQLTMVVLTTVEMAFFSILNLMAGKYASDAEAVFLGLVSCLIYVLMLTPADGFSPLIRFLVIPSNAKSFDAMFRAVAFSCGQLLLSVTVQTFLMHSADKYFRLNGDMFTCPLKMSVSHLDMLMEAVGSFALVASCLFVSDSPKYLRNMALSEVLLRFALLPLLNALGSEKLIAFFNPLSSAHLLVSCISCDFIRVIINHVCMPICLTIACLSIAQCFACHPFCLASDPFFELNRENFIEYWTGLCCKSNPSNNEISESPVEVNEELCLNQDIQEPEYKAREFSSCDDMQGKFHKSNLSLNDPLNIQTTPIFDPTHTSLPSKSGECGVPKITTNMTCGVVNPPFYMPPYNSYFPYNQLAPYNPCMPASSCYGDMNNYMASNSSGCQGMSCYQPNNLCPMPCSQPCFPPPPYPIIIKKKHKKRRPCQPVVYNPIVCRTPSPLKEKKKKKRRIQHIMLEKEDERPTSPLESLTDLKDLENERERIPKSTTPETSKHNDDNKIYTTSTDTPKINYDKKPYISHVKNRPPYAPSVNKRNCIKRKMNCLDAYDKLSLSTSKKFVDQKLSNYSGRNNDSLKYFRKNTSQHASHNNISIEDLNESLDDENFKTKQWESRESQTLNISNNENRTNESDKRWLSQKGELLKNQLRGMLATLEGQSAGSAHDLHLNNNVTRNSEYGNLTNNNILNDIAAILFQNNLANQILFNRGLSQDNLLPSGLLPKDYSGNRILPNSFNSPRTTCNITPNQPNDISLNHSGIRSAQQSPLGQLLQKSNGDTTSNVSALLQKLQTELSSNKANSKNLEEIVNLLNNHNNKNVEKKMELFVNNNGEDFKKKNNINTNYKEDIKKTFEYNNEESPKFSAVNSPSIDPEFSDNYSTRQTNSMSISSYIRSQNSGNNQTSMESRKDSITAQHANADSSINKKNNDVVSDNAEFGRKLQTVRPKDTKLKATSSMPIINMNLSITDTQRSSPVITCNSSPRDRPSKERHKDQILSDRASRDKSPKGKPAVIRWGSPRHSPPLTGDKSSLKSEIITLSEYDYRSEATSENVHKVIKHKAASPPPLSPKNKATLKKNVTDTITYGNLSNYLSISTNPDTLTSFSNYMQKSADFNGRLDSFVDTETSQSVGSVGSGKKRRLTNSSNTSQTFRDSLENENSRTSEENAIYSRSGGDSYDSDDSKSSSKGSSKSSSKASSKSSTKSTSKSSSRASTMAKYQAPFKIPLRQLTISKEEYKERTKQLHRINELNSLSPINANSRRSGRNSGSESETPLSPMQRKQLYKNSWKSSGSETESMRFSDVDGRKSPRLKFNGSPFTAAAKKSSLKSALEGTRKPQRIGKKKPFKKLRFLLPPK